MKSKDFLGIDVVLLLAALTLTVFGILFIYSAGINYGEELISSEYKRQILWAAGGLIATIILTMINYRRLFDISVYLYVGILLVLIYTCFFGRFVHGARRLIGIGSLGIQPSEFSKIILILFLARYLDSTKGSTKVLLRLIIACLLTFIPMGLILLQPDLGTALVFIPILLSMIFIAGFALRYIFFLSLFILFTVCLTLLPYWELIILRNTHPSLSILSNTRFVQVTLLTLGSILAIALVGRRVYKKTYFYWIGYGILLLIFSLGASFAAHKILKEYQIKRLIIFLDPNVDPQGAGWHIIQSITAIGSGGLLGKGYLKGTHSHYRYLPEQSTDFIFSIFSEEWGFSGGLLVFGLFFLICFRLMRIMKSSTDSFGTYIMAGILGMFMFHFVINVGMTMGIMPITGIPLFFMSYGGSALTSAMISIGLALSIYIRRFDH